MLVRPPRPEPERANEAPPVSTLSVVDRAVLDAGRAILRELPALGTAIEETRHAVTLVIDTVTKILNALRPDPTTPTGAGILAMQETVCAPIRAVFESIRTTIAEHESRTPVANRVSFIRKRILAVITAMGMGGAVVMDTIGAPEIPRPSESTSAGFRSPGSRALPSPDLSEAELFDALEHPDDVKAFLGRHTGHKYPADLFELLSTYRASPRELLNAKNLPCNAPSEFWARWLTHRGARPAIARLVPSLEKWEWKQCHEVTILRTSPGQYIIFSNDTYTVIDDCDSAEAALKKEYPTLHLLPASGLVAWVRTNDNWLARAAHLSGWNLNELPEHPLHAMDASTIELVGDSFLQRFFVLLQTKMANAPAVMLHDDPESAY